MDKTNVMRILDQKKLKYVPRAYDPAVTDGVTVAKTLGLEEARVFKTLVTESGTGEHFVFVIPVAESLDLKRAAKAVGAKSIAMIKQKELLPLTGYIHGGCSPVGMKKQFCTTFDESAELFESIYVSAGRVGFQVEVSPVELAALLRSSFAALTVE